MSDEGDFASDSSSPLASPSASPRGLAGDCPDGGMTASRITTIQLDDVPVRPDDVPERPEESEAAVAPNPLDFFRYAMSELRNLCLLLSFAPIPQEVSCELRGRILAPPPGSDKLDLENGNGFAPVAHLIEMSRILVGAITVGSVHEYEAARRIIPQLLEFKPVILIVFLTPCPFPRKLLDLVARQQDELMDTGIADVLLIPDMSPGGLKHAVNLAVKARGFDIRRMEGMLAEEPLNTTERELEELSIKHNHLLFHSIPRYCMQNFPSVNNDILETGMRLGQYQFLRKFECEEGKVVLARAGDGMPVAIKVTLKSRLSAAQQVEDINREHRFLREVIKHPHIAKCTDFVHTANRLYLVMEFYGSVNLSQYCKSQPGQHLEIEDALHSFEQIVDALGYMHSISISHRCLALNHVVVKHQQDGGGLNCTLVDFRCAVVARDNQYSNLVCALLPCIAPEMALGDAYIPRFVDSWSCGVVLLEMAGGLTSLSASVGIGSGVEEIDSVQAILEFFSKPGSHEEALRKLDDVTSPEIVGYLQDLISYPPENRAEMKDLAMMFKNRREAGRAD